MFNILIADDQINQLVAPFIGLGDTLAHDWPGAGTSCSLTFVCSAGIMEDILDSEISDMDNIVCCDNVGRCDQKAIPQNMLHCIPISEIDSMKSLITRISSSHDFHIVAIQDLGILEAIIKQRQMIEIFDVFFCDLDWSGVSSSFAGNTLTHDANPERSKDGVFTVLYTGNKNFFELLSTPLFALYWIIKAQPVGRFIPNLLEVIKCRLIRKSRLGKFDILHHFFAERGGELKLGDCMHVSEVYCRKNEGRTDPTTFDIGRFRDDFTKCEEQYKIILKPEINKDNDKKEREIFSDTFDRVRGILDSDLKLSNKCKEINNKMRELRQTFNFAPRESLDRVIGAGSIQNFDLVEPESRYGFSEEIEEGLKLLWNQLVGEVSCEISRVEYDDIVGYKWIFTQSGKPTEVDAKPNPLTEHDMKRFFETDSHSGGTSFPRITEKLSDYFTIVVERVSDREDIPYQAILLENQNVKDYEEDLEDKLLDLGLRFTLEYCVKEGYSRPGEVDIDGEM